VFYFRWEHKYIKDHGIWEHITWINKHFPDVLKTRVLISYKANSRGGKVNWGRRGSRVLDQL
jgi:hypothetical protein